MAKEGKKKKPGLIIAGIIGLLVVIGIAGGSGGSDDELSSQDKVQTSDSDELKVMHGELISSIENKTDDKSIVVVKTKIKPSYNNGATINQNYFNVEDLIKNKEFDKYDEIQYWAIADMENGSESKVISFTVDSKTIAKIKSDEIPATTYGEYVSDLWILPSLKE